MIGRSVDVFVADLRSVAADEDLLSVAELGQALAIASSPHLIEFLAARTWVRRVLARYLDCAPDEIRFTSGDSFAIVEPATDLTVSLGYANQVALLAIGFRREVGVGIDCLTGDVSDAKEMSGALAGEELDRFERGINPERTYRQFLARKQALHRARGPQEATASVDTSGLSPVQIGDYLVSDLSLGDNLVASVASLGEVDLNLTIDDSVMHTAARSARERVDALLGVSA